MFPELAHNDKKTGILLVNLGSPEKPTTSAVRRYLKEFLGDPRVVNLPRIVWWVVLNFLVLPFRPAKSAKAYKKIWTPAGSPLITLTQSLTDKLAKYFNADNFTIAMAMRYGKPGILTQLRRLKKQGIEKLIVLPLYPQYSSTTTASVYDAVFAEIGHWRYIPEVIFINEYYQDRHYIESIVATIKQSWQQRKKNPLLLMSFHGLPAKLSEWGDPYALQCKKTAALIAEQLELKDSEWLLVFQSRFGKAEWLQPYCVDTLENLPGKGVKAIDIVCPGFAVDCLETLEEIAITNRALYMAAGGEAYCYIPALNDSDIHSKALINLIERYLLQES